MTPTKPEDALVEELLFERATCGRHSGEGYGLTGIMRLQSLLERSADAITTLLERIGKLEEALEPLALLAGGDVNMNDPLSKWFRVGHLMDARAALTGDGVT